LILEKKKPDSVDGQAIPNVGANAGSASSRKGIRTEGKLAVVGNRHFDSDTAGKLREQSVPERARPYG